MKVIHSIDPRSGATVPELQIDLGGGPYEGIDYAQAELRWLIDLGAARRRVYYFVPQ